MRSFGTTVSLVPEVQPELLQAVWLILTNELFLIFDVPMLPVDVNGLNLFIRVTNLERILRFADYPQPDRAHYTQLNILPSEGSNLCSYIGPEMLFLSAEGIPAKGWTDFQVTTVPP